MKRTPLFECHGEHGARFVDFGGWEMPVQYTGIQKEHDAVRTHAGLFDVRVTRGLWILSSPLVCFSMMVAD